MNRVRKYEVSRQEPMADKTDSPTPTPAEVLETVERHLDAIAAEHESHDCGTTEIALGLSAGIKMKREALGASSGPAQVATDKYRRNYDMIFMSKGGSA